LRIAFLCPATQRSSTAESKCRYGRGLKPAEAGCLFPRIRLQGASVALRPCRKSWRRAMSDNELEKSSHEHPKIVLRPGKLIEAVDQAEEALLEHCEQFGIFQRAGELVRIFSLPEPHEDGRLRRPKGTVQLELLGNTALTEVFNRVARWRRQESNRIVRVDCPPRIAAFYNTRTGSWRLPVLAGIISAPILREDGSVLEEPGYDTVTGLYLGSDEDSPEIPKRPTRADAEAALRILREPFAEFPFVSDGDRAAHIACILTAIQRRLLQACPIFGYSAPTQRSGKSLLAESVAIIATGKPAAATAISGEREEIRKMITSVLREGHSIINLDNMEHVLASPDLAMAITQSEYQDRALGTNRTLRLPTTVLWTATGNNLTFRGDLSSRALLSRIDPQMEAPEHRTFRIPDLRDYLKRNRKKLLAAALTVLRAYHVDGRPRQPVKPWGGFEDWSALIREPLVWLGMADPCQTRSVVVADDPEREESLAALRVLHEKFHHEEFTVKRILRRCNSSGTLRRAIETVAGGSQKEIDSRRLGWWLRRNKDRILGGLRLEAIGKSSGVVRWRMVEVLGGHRGHGGHSRPSGASAKRFPGPGNTPARDGTIKRFPRLPTKQQSNAKH
jgi:putative DNA primase/helicase